MLPSYKFWSGIFVLLCLGTSVFTQENAALELDIDTATDYALKSNLAVKSAELYLSDKRFAKDSSWNTFVPSISVGATLSRMNEEPATMDLTFLNPLFTMHGLPSLSASSISQWNLSAVLNAQLNISLASFHGIRKTVLDYEAGLTSYAKAKSDLARGVKKQFYGLLLLKEQIRVAQATVNNAQERYNQAVVDYRNGMISEYAMLKNQVYLENTKPMLVALENAYADYQLLFKFTIGIELSQEITLKGSLDTTTRDFDAKKLAEKYISQRYDVIKARQAIDSVKNSIDLASSSMFPILSLGFTYDPTINGPFENDLLNSDNWAQQRGALSLTITQFIDPLLPSSQTRVTLSALNSQLYIAEENLKLAMKNAEMSITSTVRILQKARSTITSKEINVRVAERAYALARESYYAGGMELLEVKDTEQALEQARIDLLQEKYNYLTGLLDLEFELNTPMVELESSNEQ